MCKEIIKSLADSDCFAFNIMSHGICLIIFRVAKLLERMF